MSMSSDTSHRLYFKVGPSEIKTLVETSVVPINGLHGAWHELDFTFNQLHTYEMPTTTIRTGTMSYTNSDLLLTTKHGNDIYEIKYFFKNIGSNVGFNVIEMSVRLYKNSNDISGINGCLVEDIWGAYEGGSRLFTQNSNLTNCILDRFFILPPIQANYSNSNFTPSIYDFDTNTMLLNGTTYNTINGGFTIGFCSSNDLTLVMSDLNNNTNSSPFTPRLIIPWTFAATSTSTFTNISDFNTFIEYISGESEVKPEDWTDDDLIYELEEDQVDISYQGYMWETGDPTYMPTEAELNQGSIVSVGVHKCYELDNTSLRNFTQGLLDPSFITNLKNIFANDPMDGVISLKRFPFNPEHGALNNISIGSYTVEYNSNPVQGLSINKQYQIIDCGSIYINPKYGNFLDYNPYTKLKVYLPWVGIVDVNVDYWMGKNNIPLGVKYAVDLISGDFMCFITGGSTYVVPQSGSYSITTKDNVYYQFDGAMGEDIPLTASNKAQRDMGKIQTGVTSVAALATGNPLVGGSAIASATSCFKDDINIQGRYKPTSGWCSILKPHIILIRPNVVFPRDYGSILGYPCNMKDTLSNLSGFTKIKEINLSCSGTEDEKNEIERLLKEGVIL